MEKVELFRPSFDQVWLRPKIARKSPKNLLLLLSIKWVPKSTFKFQLWESRQKCIFSTLVWPTLNEVQNNSKYHKIRCPCLSLKWVSKRIYKFQFWETGKRCNFIGLGLTKLDLWPTCTFVCLDLTNIDYILK